MTNQPKPTTKTTSKTNPATRHLKDIASLSKEDREKFVLEMAEQNMPSQELLSKMAKTIASMRYEMYKAHVDAGFTEEQAMHLCLQKA